MNNPLPPLTPVEVGTEGVGTLQHAVITRDGKFLATVMRSGLDILSEEVREQVLAKMAPSANSGPKPHQPD